MLLEFNFKLGRLIIGCLYCWISNVGLHSVAFTYCVCYLLGCTRRLRTTNTCTCCWKRVLAENCGVFCETGVCRIMYHVYYHSKLIVTERK